MKKKILLLCLVAMMLFVTGCGNTGTGGNTGKNELQQENEKLTDKINSEVLQMVNGELVVVLKNDNKVDVNVDIEVEFYDENGQFIKAAQDYAYGLGAGREAAVDVYDVPEKFATYKVYADATKSYSITYYDKVELTHSNNGEEIIAQVKNNSGQVIDSIQIAVIYYKDGKAIGYEYDLESDVKADRTANFSLDYPYDKNYRKIPFDTYKVYLNSAESYNY